MDVTTYFLHDVDPAIVEEGKEHERVEADIAFESVCDFASWPAIGIRVLAGADDRFFPVGLGTGLLGTGSTSTRTRSPEGTCSPSCTRGW